MSFPIAQILTSLVVASALFALVCRLVARSSEGHFSRLLGIWVLLATGMELFGAAAVYMQVDTIRYYNFYWVVEFCMLLAIGETIHPRARWLRWAMLGTFGLIWVLDMYRVGSRPMLVTGSVITGALMLGAYYLALLWWVAHTWQGPLRRSPTFWLSLSVLLYYGPAAPLISSINYFIQVDMALASRLFWITQVFCIIKFFGVGITCTCMALPDETASSHDRAH